MRGLQDFPSIAGFEIEETLVRGATSWICKARQKSLNRFVALKILDVDVAEDQTEVDRFLREARRRRSFLARSISRASNQAAS